MSLVNISSACHGEMWDLEALGRAGSQMDRQIASVKRESKTNRNKNSMAQGSRHWPGSGLIPGPTSTSWD